MSNLETFVTTIATIVIAYATWQVWRVYETMSGQIDREIALTRDIFLQSHAPALSVSLVKCVYLPNGERLDVVIIVKNHGSFAAKEINLRIEFGETNAVKDITHVAIQPGNDLTYPFSLKVTTQRYETSKMQGNRLSSYAHGSYKGVADTTYRYEERAEYYPELNRFVPYWTE